MQKPNIEIPKEKIRRFCEEHHIRHLALFGSVLTKQFNKNSDVDFLVEFESDYEPSLFGIVTMEEELKGLVGRPVDLRTPQDLSPYFRNEVITKAKLLYGKGRFKPT